MRTRAMGIELWRGSERGNNYFERGCCGFISSCFLLVCMYQVD